MNLLTHLLFVASLAALSLAGCSQVYECSDESCESDTEGATGSQDYERIRVEIEVVGTGTVFVDGPEPVSCSGDQGLCSFSYAIGTQLPVYASGEEGAASFEDACEGIGDCLITLDSDQVLVVVFDETKSSTPPDIIVDPFPGWRPYDIEQASATVDTASER